MTRNRKRTPVRTPPPAPPGRPSRRAQVWLATLGTVVGVATGMVALARDVMPEHSGSAQASDSREVQQTVGSICDDVDRHDADRVRDAVLLGRRLRRASTPLRARDALLEAYQRTLRDAEHDEARFAALPAVPSLGATQRVTTRAWTDTLDRLRGIVAALDGAGDWSALEAVGSRISAARTPIDRDVSTVRTGLLRTGGGQCHLDAQGVTRAVVLPPHRRPKPPSPATPDGPVEPPPAQSPAPPATGTSPVEPPPATQPSDPVEPPAPSPPPPGAVEPPPGGGGAG